MLKITQESTKIADYLTPYDVSKISERAHYKLLEMHSNKIVNSPETAYRDTFKGFLHEELVARLTGGYVNHRDYDGNDWMTYAFDVVTGSDELLEIKSFREIKNSNYLRFNTKKNVEAARMRGIYPPSAGCFQTFIRHSYKLDYLVIVESDLRNDYFKVKYIIDSKSFKQYHMKADYSNPRFRHLPTDAYHTPRAIREGNCLAL